MDSHEMLTRLEKLIEEVHAGVLSSLDNAGEPHMRWMIPTLLKGKSNALYAVSCPHFDWVQALEKHAAGEWMFQNIALTEIFRVKGKIRVLDNPSLKSDILEQIASLLTAFWKTNSSTTDFVAIETIIEEITYSQPMQGTKTSVKFPAFLPE